MSEKEGFSEQKKEKKKRVQERKRKDEMKKKKKSALKCQTFSTGVKLIAHKNVYSWELSISE